MSTTFWANPLQTFVTYVQARRAAKSASIVAWLIAALGAWVVARFWLSGAATRVTSLTILMTVPATLLTLGAGLLGWRIWVRPGPWKTFAILAFVAWDVIRAIFGFASFTPTFVVSFILLGLVLNVCLIAFRGALAMKRLHVQPDLDVF